MLDLTLLDQVLHRAGNVFDWHVRVYPLLIEQVDDIDYGSFRVASSKTLGSSSVRASIIAPSNIAITRSAL